MNDFLYSVLAGIIVGGGSILGACLAFWLKNTGKRLSSVLLGLAGGIILATFFFDMLPHSLAEAGNLNGFLGIVAGAGVMLAVTLLVPHKDAADMDELSTERLKREGRSDGHGLARTGLLLALGMAIHNLPQGIALGGGVTSGIAFSLALLLFSHNIPEGMAMAIPLRLGGVGKGRILSIALLSALPTVLGAAIGSLVSGISDQLMGVCVAFAGGAMIFLTLKELLPQALRLQSKTAGQRGNALVALAAVAGAAIGGLVVWITH